MSHKCSLRAKLSLGEKWQLLPNVYIHWQLRVSPKSDKCFSGGTSTLVDSCSFQIHDHKYQNMLWIASYPKAQLHKWKKNSPQTSHHSPMQEMTLFHHSHAKCRCFQSINHYWRDGASGPQELADLTGLTWLMWETIKTKARDNGRQSLSPWLPMYISIHTYAPIPVYHTLWHCKT